ncbi:MAG TPA: transporter substrate-binding domain-containing protein [Flavobacteriaceae bacterium]|nr:transporter substrate-binding domain-containing protein [Flavobacteriaceae bacterium]
MKFFQYFLCSVLCFLAFATHSQNILKDTMRVGYVGSAPFVIQSTNNGQPKGIVFDIWEEIAFSLEKPYHLEPVSTIDEGVSALQREKLDLLIGPITINSSRAAKVAFSQPFFDTELALLAPKLEAGFWDNLKPFFSSAFLFAILGLLLTLAFVGFLFWMVEGRHFPEDYPKKPIECIGIGMWLAVVTMTTVGYGDFAPKTPKGRVVMGSWMIISLILATTFVAGIATSFSKVGQTNQTITSLNQLHGKEVAIPSNQKVAELIRTVEGQAVMVEDVSEGYSLLLEGKVDAVLYDEVPLEYIFETGKKEDYQLTKKNIDPQHYGFMFLNESDLKRAVDQQIIQMRESKEIQKIISKWISSR